MAVAVVEQKMDGEVLVQEFLRTGNRILKDKIVESFAPLVKHVVGRINVSHSATLSNSDLYQSGVLGLLKALERFKPDMGVPFKTYAYKRIHGEVIDSLRREGFIGRDKYEQVKTLEKTINRLTAELGMEPSPEEVCRAMSISEEEYYSIMNTSQLTYMTSLNTKIADGEGDFVYKIDMLVDDNQLSPEEEVIRENQKVRMKELIERLPERQKLVLALYFYEELTLADIGKVLDLSEARISQILNKTLLELRAQL